MHQGEIVMQVIFFTGTGNSKYVAERIAEMTGAGITDAGRKIKADETIVVKDEDVVICTPVYAWRTPRILEEWLRRSDFNAAKRIWYVMTCGDQIGGADKFNAQLSRDLGCQHMGTGEIIMPENYIALFNAPFPEEARQIIADAEGPITACGQLIADGIPIPPAPQKIVYKMSSSAVNSIFSKIFIKDKAFRAEDNCISCGQCVDLCPLNNITIVSGRPQWGGNCTHCMACICYCPKEAIEYGRGSRGRFRYNFERLY